MEESIFFEYRCKIYEKFTEKLSKSPVNIMSGLSESRFFFYSSPITRSAAKTAAQAQTATVTRLFSL